MGLTGTVSLTIRLERTKEELVLRNMTETSFIKIRVAHEDYKWFVFFQWVISFLADRLSVVKKTLCSNKCVLS